MRITYHWGIFILLCLTSLPAYGQSVVEGTVADSAGVPIPNVNLYITGPDSSTIKAYDYSDANGHFSIALPAIANRLLHASAIGFAKHILPLPATTPGDTLRRPITLQTEETQLKELVVEAERSPVITNGDSTIFNAEAFMRGNEESVEDILEQLPGISVGSDGRLKANGQTVTKVLIGGDDLFGFNYSLLTKNFTADAIETVSVYENFQENALLQGISNAEETVIDLALKDEFKVDFFGTLTAYYDGNQNYEADGNLVSITPKFKGYVFENINNVGEDPSGNIYNLLRSSASLPFQSGSTLGRNAQASELVGQGEYRVAQLDQERYLRNQTGFHALGGIYNPSKKLKLKGVGYFLPTDRAINQQFSTRYDASLGVPDLQRSEATKKSIDAALGNLMADYSINEKSALQYEGRFKLFPADVAGSQQFRRQPLTTNLDSRDRLWNQQLRYTRKLAEQKAYRLRLRYKNQRITQDLRVDPRLSGGPFSGDSTAAIGQQNRGTASYLGADITYWSRSEKGLLTLRGGGERTANGLANRIANEPTFSGRRYWDRYRGFATLSYEYRPLQGLKAEGSLSANAIANRTNLSKDIDDELLYLNPQATLTYEPNKRHEARLRYSYNQQLPSPAALFQPGRLTGYQSIARGTADFFLMPTNSLSASYRYGDWSEDLVMNAFVAYSASPRNYTTATTVTPTYSIGQFRRQDNQQTFTGRAEADYFVNALQSNLAGEYTYTNSRFTSYFNNRAEAIRAQSHLVSGYLRTAFVGKLNGSLGIDYSLSRSQNLTNPFTSEFYSTSAFASATYQFSDRWQLSSEYTLYQIENAGDYHFLDASLNFDAINDKLTLYLDGRNLLDQTAFETVNTGAYTISQQRDVLNPRFVLVGAKLNFR